MPVNFSRHHLFARLGVGLAALWTEIVVSRCALRADPWDL
jgi:hypothetical protein